MSSTNSHQDEETGAKYSQVRGVRREGQAARAKRNRPRPSTRNARPPQRTVMVRGQLRDKPDIKRLARAAVQHALAEAQKESQRIAAMETASHAAQGEASEDDRA